METKPLEPPHITQPNQGAIWETNTMKMGVMTMRLCITGRHTDPMLMTEPATEKAKDVPSTRQQASVHVIRTMVEAVETKMNNFFETR